MARPFAADFEMSSTLIDAQLGSGGPGWRSLWPCRRRCRRSGAIPVRYLGDTVNVAARMSETSVSGSVAVTKEVWELIGHDFEGKALGEMEVKGKGTISVFGLLPRTAVKTGFSLVT